MQKFFEAVKVIDKQVWNDGILNVTFSQVELPRVHVHGRFFKDLVEETLELLPCYVAREDRVESEYDVELSVEKDGIVFFAIMTEADYLFDFEKWHDEEFDDEEFVTGVGPDNEARMREAGHKLEDFA